MSNEPSNNLGRPQFDPYTSLPQLLTDATYMNEAIDNISSRLADFLLSDYFASTPKHAKVALRAARKTLVSASHSLTTASRYLALMNPEDFKRSQPHSSKSHNSHKHIRFTPFHRK